MTTTVVAIALLSIGRMEMTLPATNHKALLEGFAFVIGIWAVDSETSRKRTEAVPARRRGS